MRVRFSLSDICEYTETFTPNSDGSELSSMSIVPSGHVTYSESQERKDIVVGFFFLLRSRVLIS